MNKIYIKSLISISVIIVLFITGMVFVKSQVISDIDIAEVSDEGFIMGNPDSDIRVIEYSNFECSFCQENNRNLHDTMKELVEKNEILYIWKPITIKKYPLGNKAVHFIDPEMGDTKLLDTIDTIFEHANSWGDYDSNDLNKEMIDTLKLKRVDHSDLQLSLDNEADAVGVKSTPTIIINDEVYRGILTKEKLRDVIDSIKNN